MSQKVRAKNSISVKSPKIASFSKMKFFFYHFVTLQLFFLTLACLFSYHEKSRCFALTGKKSFDFFQLLFLSFNKYVQTYVTRTTFSFEILML